MHPVIRITSFLVVAISLAQLNQVKLLTAAIFLLLFYFIQPSHEAARRTAKLVYRLRWLFLSIIVIYAWFTPGLLLIPEWGTYSPHKEGVIAGVMRVLALVIIIATLAVLVLSIARDKLISAIYWYCRPLKYIGIDVQRVVARLILTMDYVAQLQSVWKEKVASVDSTGSTIQNNYQRILQLFNNVIERAEQSELSTITFSLEETPPLMQWLVPLAMVIIFLTV